MTGTRTNKSPGAARFFKTHQLACVLLLFGCCCLFAQQQNGMWRADSQTARSITGDIALADQKITLNFTSFPMIRVRELTPAELSAAFDAGATTPGSGSLYKLSIPAGKTFLRRNTLCGKESTEWLATYVSKNALQLAFFSGQRPPVFTLEAISNSTDTCGTYTYFR
jgi:hypothetical protein